MLLQLAQLSLGRKLVDGQGWGQKEAVSSPVPSLFCTSVYLLSQVAPLSPATLLPDPLLGMGATLTVQGGRQGRDFISPLPVGEGCGVFQGAAWWEREKGFWGFKPDPGDLELTKTLLDSPIHSPLMLLELSPES